MHLIPICAYLLRYTSKVTQFVDILSLHISNIYKNPWNRPKYMFLSVDWKSVKNPYTADCSIYWTSLLINLFKIPSGIWITLKWILPKHWNYSAIHDDNDTITHWEQIKQLSSLILWSIRLRNVLAWLINCCGTTVLEIDVQSCPPSIWHRIYILQ